MTTRTRMGQQVIMTLFLLLLCLSPASATDTGSPAKETNPLTTPWNNCFIWDSLYTDWWSINTILGDGVAYINDYEQLILLDISNPYHPLEASSLQIDDYEDVWKTQVIDENLIVVSKPFSLYNYAISVLDVSDPYNPSFEMWKVNLEDLHHSSKMDLAECEPVQFRTTDRGLILLDAADPENITYLATVDSGQYIIDAELAGTLAIVWQQDGLSISDISNPTSPVPVSLTAKEGYFRNLTVYENHVYLCAYNEIVVYDITDPTSPQLAATLPITITRKIHRNANLLYVNQEENGIRIFDLEESPTLQSWTQLNDPNSFYSVSNDSLLLAVGGIGRFYQSSRLYKKAPDNSWTQVSEVCGGTFIHSMVRDSTLLYCAAGPRGIKVADVSDPLDIRDAGGWLDDSYAGNLVQYDSLLFVSTQYEGIKILSLDNPHYPVYRNSITDCDTTVDLSIEGSHLYVANGMSGLMIYDLTDPIHPALIAQELFPDPVRYVEASGDLVFLGLDNKDFQIVDVHDPSAPIKRDKLSFEACPTSFARYHDMVYVGTSGHMLDNGLYVVEVDNMGNILSTVEHGYAYSGRSWVTLVDSTLYWSHDRVRSHLTVYNLGSQGNPVTTFSDDIQGTVVVPNDSTLLIAHYERLYSVGYDPLDALDETVWSVPQEFQLATPYPNPFNAQVTIPFNLQKRQRVKLTLFDVLGRQVLVVADQVYLPGTHHHSMSAEGLASGVYFIRLTSADASHSETRRIVLIR